MKLVNLVLLFNYNCKEECQFGCKNANLNTPNILLSHCGDHKCDNRIETCNNCEIDCGKCFTFTYMDKCIEKNQISLTFYNGPTELSPNLLDLLKSLKIKATFFYLGEKLNNPRLAKYALRAFSEGHIIGSYTYSQPYLAKLNDFDIREEMLKADLKIYNLIKEIPKFMKSFNMDNNRVSSVINSMGYEYINSSLDADLKDQPLNKTTELIKSKLKNSSTNNYIINVNESLIGSIDLLYEIIDSIKNFGYEMVNLEDCLNIPAYKPSLHETCGNNRCDGYIENCKTCPLDCGECSK